MSSDLATDLGTQETAALEFKSSALDRKAIGRAVCALANDLAGRGGGDVLIGVDKHGNAVDAVDTTDETLLALTDLRDSGKILDRPSMTVEVGPYQGKSIIRIHVEASATPPVRFDGVVWVRPGPTTRRASPDDERVLTERRRAASGPFDSRPVPASVMADLDLALFKTTYLPSVVDPEVLEENNRPVEHQLASLHLADKNGTPTVVGLLVLGLDPSSFLPGAYVQFVRYEGDGLDAAVSDEQEIRANVIGVASRLEILIKGNIHTAVSSVAPDSVRDEQRPDYPFNALREVCMNAIMHRNYESSYAPVRISWFNSRVEVANPGGPFGQVRVDNFDRVNDYRNPSLASAMKSLGYVNRFGRGIARIRSTLEKNGNPPPEFAVDDSSWSVVLRRPT